MPRNILKNTPKTKKYLESLPKVYALCLWAKWAIVDVYWSGKYNKDMIPLVYIYRDDNGTCDEYRLVPIHYVSSGFWNWYQSKSDAEYVRDQLNKNPDFESGE